MALGMATALRTDRAQAIDDFAGASALIRIYDGTRPATGGTATTLLAELTCGATLGTVSAGVLTLGSVTEDSSANADGTATWARIVKSDGTTHVLDMSVGTSGADLNLNSVSITTGVAVQITSGTITEGDA
jgi:hypothetical protein